MHLTIRTAHAGDHQRLAAIGAEPASTTTGDAGGIDSHYLAFVAAAGRLLVATSDGVTVAFAGMVPVGDVVMVTDLFVTTDARGHGVGGALLEAVLHGRARRMTCSSQHPAALPVYARAGMAPRWRLLYLHGQAAGGGRPLVPARWAGDRPALVRHFADRGSIVSATTIVRVDDDGATVERAQGSHAIERFAGVMAALPAGLPLRACVPEPHPLARWLLDRGFVVADHDVFCASPGVQFPAGVSCVHPGLA